MWYLDKEKTQFVHATASKKEKIFCKNQIRIQNMYSQFKYD